MADVKEYQINGTTYCQRPLVLGQIQELLQLLSNLSTQLPKIDLGEIKSDVKRSLDQLGSDQNQEKDEAQWGERAKTLKTIALLGDNITDALMIILCPKDKPLPEKDKEAMKTDLYVCPPEVIIEVVQDFFVISRNSKAWEVIKTSLAPKLKTRLNTSKGSSTPSQKGI